MRGNRGGGGMRGILKRKGRDMGARAGRWAGGRQPSLVSKPRPTRIRTPAQGVSNAIKPVGEAIRAASGSVAYSAVANRNVRVRGGRGLEERGRGGGRC